MYKPSAKEKVDEIKTFAKSLERVGITKEVLIDVISLKVLYMDL